MTENAELFISANPKQPKKKDKKEKIKIAILDS